MALNDDAPVLKKTVRRCHSGIAIESAGGYSSGGTNRLIQTAERN
jgi:hypothetical protein